MNDAHYLKSAKECSLKSDYTGYNRASIGCVAVYKGSILAKGWNTDRTHTDQAKYNKWRFKASGNSYMPEKMHAEQMCISKIKYLEIDFSRVRLYIYREHKNGDLAMARCCPSCIAAAKDLGIETIVYTTPDGFAIEKLRSL